MKPPLRTALVAGVPILATFLATAAYYNQRVSKQVLAAFVAEGVRMEAFNDVGRVETYDTLEDFLRRGCTKEALQFVQDQRALLLGGLAYRMKASEGTRATVQARSASIAERAAAEPLKGRPSVVYIPRCA